MKKQITILITLLSAVFFGTISCQPNSSEKLQEAQLEAAEADQVLSNAKEEYIADIETFKEEAVMKISANEKNIKELKTRIDSSKNDVKAHYDQKVNNLELKNAELKKRLVEYEAAGKDQWNDFKNELNLEMEEMESALQDITIGNE